MRLVQSTLVSAMLQPHMRPTKVKSVKVKVAIATHL